MLDKRYVALLCLVVFVAFAGVWWSQPNRESPEIRFEHDADLFTPEQGSADGVALTNDISGEQAESDVLFSSNGDSPGSSVAESVAEITSQIEQNTADSSLDQQIAVAREKLAQVEALNARKLAHIDEILEREGTVEKSLLEVELAYHLQGWRDSWQRGDTQRYFDFYSEDFSPSDGKTLEQWRVQRAKRVNPTRKIGLEMNDFAVDFDAATQRCLVTFEQRYRSGDYRETSRKRLILVKEQELWRIVAETQQ